MSVVLLSSPAEAAKPTQGTEAGKIHIDRPAMRDASGACWQWRGFSDFLLFYRFLTGVDVHPIIDERIALGANVLRVFSMVSWSDLNPLFYPKNFATYYTQLREFADQVAAKGMRIELTIFADAQIVMPDATERHAHAEACIEALQGTWNVFVEVSNEPFKNLPGGDNEAITIAKLIQGHGLLIASGEYDSWPPAPSADYGTTHCDRTSDWPRKCKDLKDRTDYSNHTPWIGDEPMGCAEVASGSRDTDADDFAWYAAGSQMFGPGATFHCDDGVSSRSPIGPTQSACARAFFDALTWTPREALLWPYQRGDMGSEAGIGNMPILHDDAKSSRTYCKGNGHQEWCCAIQCTDDWQAIARDGWRIVSQPRRGFIYLEKP